MLKPWELGRKLGCRRKTGFVFGWQGVELDEL